MDWIVEKSELRVVQVSSDIDTESERWNDDTYHYDQSLLTIFTVSVTDFEMSVHWVYYTQIRWPKGMHWICIMHI